MKRHFISARVSSHFRYILLSVIWSVQAVCRALILVCWALAALLMWGACEAEDWILRRENESEDPRP